jgi:VanZ family protein
VCVRSWVRAWAPAAIWAIFLFILSATPGSDLPELPGNSDKLVHGAVYAVLGALCFWGVRFTSAFGPPRAVALATGLAALFGITDEFHQAFTPKRTPADWRDAAADAIGGLIGAFALGLLFSRRRDS